MKARKLLFDGGQSCEGTGEAEYRDFPTATGMPQKQRQILLFLGVKSAANAANGNEPAVGNFWDKQPDTACFADQRQKFLKVRLARRMPRIPRSGSMSCRSRARDCRQ
jgi:hypothetical protein